MQVVRLLTVAAFAGSSRHLPISPIHLASNGCWVWLVAARTNSTLQGTVNILLWACETQTHTTGLGQRRGMELRSTERGWKRLWWWWGDGPTAQKPMQSIALSINCNLGNENLWNYSQANTSSCACSCLHSSCKIQKFKPSWEKSCVSSFLHACTWIHAYTVCPTIH